MKRTGIIFSIVLVLGLMAGCSYFQKKDEPPPLPPIEETKPPLTLKGDYFKSFPWDELPKPLKNGNDPDTMVYTAKEGETLEEIAEKTMGNRALASGLASFNDLSSPLSVPAGEKLVIPYPIIGVSSQMLVKEKGEKEFSSPKPFDTELKRGDQYKLRFEPNVDGYCYIFREGPKGTVMLYPSKPPRTKKKRGQPSITPSAKVTAFEPIIIPAGRNGFRFNPKRAGDRIYIFLSLRTIPELEDLREKKKISVQDIQDVMHRVKIGEIFTDEPPYTLLRVADPSEILGRSLNLSG
jgi:LysM repeat protein